MPRSAATAAARIGLAASLLLAPAAGQAIPPPVTVYHSYYGPLTFCRPGFAVDIRAGEGFSASTREPSHLSFPGGRLYFSHDAAPIEGNRYGEPLGTVGTASGTRLHRMRLPPSEGRARFEYVYDAADGSPLPIRRIGSELFDGTDADLGWINRIRFGAAAEHHCASIPEERRAVPSRADGDAWAWNPRRHPGPMVLCTERFAFEVAAGEAAILLWDGDDLFQVTRGGERMGANTRDWGSGSFTDAAAPVAASPRVRLVEGIVESYTGTPYPIPAEGPQTILLLRDDRHAEGTRIVRKVEFTFTRGVRREQRLALVHRLRPRLPTDACFTPPSSAAAARANIGAVTPGARR